MNNIKNHESYGKISFGKVLSNTPSNFYMDIKAKEYINVEIYESALITDKNSNEYPAKGKILLSFKLSKKQLFELFINKASHITFKYKPENFTLKSVEDCPYKHKFDDIQENLKEEIKTLNAENFEIIKEIINDIDTLNIPKKHKNSLKIKINGIINSWLNNYNYYIQKAKETVSRFFNEN